MKMMRDTTISICKALAIILMVAGHAECPSLLSRFLYEFHMPLFFIASGYFFSLKYVNDETTFVKKRSKGAYVPFVKWSVFFLLLHNLMFKIGLLNEQYGNISGGVTHPYTWHQIQQNLWHIVTFMSGYDVFLAGAFWFFRALLVGSVLYLLLFKLVLNVLQRLNTKDFQQLTHRNASIIRVVVCVVVLLLCAWKTSERLSISSLAQGGYRDLMACFFIGCGHLMQGRLQKIGSSWLITLFSFIVVMLFAVYAPSSMAWNATFNQFVRLPIPALCGFIMTYNVSCFINRHDNIIKRFLVFCGNNTLYVLVFHIIAYKVVSVIKIVYYGLDWQQIGCHMVVHEHANDDCFWLFYTIVGVGLPIALRYFFLKIKRNREQQRLL